MAAADHFVLRVTPGIRPYARCQYLKVSQCSKRFISARDVFAGTCATADYCLLDAWMDVRSIKL
eukprot:COSAG02_NODE_1327_length_13220_cov_11.602241_14_plen_64_part_00